MPPQRFGKFEVTAELGRGGQGTVLRARDPAGREVALKVLLRADDRSERRFRQEVQVLARLTHPGIVRVLDAGVEDGAPWLAMALVQGESLGRRLERGGPLPPIEAARLVAALARAIACCHEGGVVHRDLKPENVLIDGATGAPVLVDFGLIRRDAEVFGPLSIDARSKLSTTGELRGTPAYMAPEQVSPTRFGPVGPGTDVYGLGGVLCAALTGDPPHVAESFPGLLVSIIEGNLPDLAARRPDLPAPLVAVCLRALAAQPAERWPSANALADALEAFAEGREVHDLPRRGARSWLELAAGLLVLASGVAVIARRGAEASPAAPTVPAVPLPPPSTPPGAPSAPPAAAWSTRVESASRAAWPAQAHVRLRHVTHLAREAPHVVRACFLDDGRVVTVGPDRAGARTGLRVWTLDGEAEVQTQPDLEVALPITTPWLDLAVLAPGRLVVVGAGDSTSRSFIGELEGPRLLPWSLPQGSLAGAVAPAGDELLIAEVHDRRESRSWSLVSRARRDGSTRELFRIPYLVRDMDVSGDTLAVVARRPPENAADTGVSAIVVWDLARGVERWRDEQVPLASWVVTILPGDDGRRIAVGKGGGYLEVIDTRTGESTRLASRETRPSADGGLFEHAAPSAHGSSVHGLALGRDGTLWSVSGSSEGGKLLATRDGELRAWGPGGEAIERRTRPAGGNTRATAQTALPGLASLAASPDGRALVAGGDEGEAQVWILPASP